MPVKLVVNEVMLTPCAVRPYWSTLSVLIAGVALEVSVRTRGVTRLLVSVVVPVGVT